MHLDIGVFSTIDNGFPTFLKQFLNLKFLRFSLYNIEINNYNTITEVFNTIINLKKLECLELVNISHIFLKNELEKCPKLKKLHIILADTTNVSTYKLNFFLLNII